MTMREAKTITVSIVDELTSPKTIQAILTLIVTITLMVMIALERSIHDYLTFAWFTLIGLYMALPKKSTKISS